MLPVSSREGSVPWIYRTPYTLGRPNGWTRVEHDSLSNFFAHSLDDLEYRDPGF